MNADQNEMDIKVSVIIPVYNAEDYIGECLESIINQTLKEIEIICVNDGSTDGSSKVLEEYRKKDSRIIVIDQTNSGAGAARNNGLRYARGEYLSILDSDDFFEPTMLEEAYSRAHDEDLDIIVFACDLYDNNEKSYRPCSYAIHDNLLPDFQPFAGADVKKDIFKLFVGWSWDKLFRRSFIEENGLTFQEQRTTNDMLFVFSAVVKAGRIMTYPKVLAHHRKEVGGLSVTREKSWMCFYNALTALRKQLKDWDLFDRFEQDYLNYCVHFSLWNLNTLAEPTHTMLYNKLRDEWYDELGVTAHDESYYYNKYEYKEYRKVYDNPPQTHTDEGKGSDPAPGKEIRGTLFERGLRCLRENGLRYTVKRLISGLRCRFR